MKPAPTRIRPDDEPGVPVATWIISGIALVVALTAGALALSARPQDAVSEMEDAVSPESPDGVEASSKPLQKNPLEITRSFLDAQTRSKLWNPTAALSGIELIVEDGRPSGPITFEFGEAIGQSVPGAPLSEKRLVVSYNKGSVETKTTESAVRRVALPEPNCPLEVAFSTLVRSGTDTTGRFGVLYAQSQKHARPVWLMTSESGESTHLSADSCTLLRR